MIDKKFRVPRLWSNKELSKFSSQFYGKVVNVSGWKDIDKNGSTYSEYFINKSEYWISNYKAEARGFQGNINNEFFLDLESSLSEELIEKFDVVYNHTVLEHIFNVNQAFENLCKLSKDIVILVVPFLQEQHADYGDFWRFTPLTIEKLFKQNGMDLIYINYNDNSADSIYIFAIASKNKSKWNNIIENKDNKINEISNYKIGRKIIKNNIFFKLNLLRKKILNLLFKEKYENC